MSKDPDPPPSFPTSEVGYERAENVPSVNGNNERCVNANNERCDNASDDRWRALFEAQNENMKALIRTLHTPGTSSIVLPEFNPDKPDANAQSWCATADLCMADNPLEGGRLIVVISKALKGAASTWLSQVTYPGINWAQFKQLFTERFVCTETSAGTLINLNNDKPNENETLAAYASRLMTSLMTQWKNLDKEQIAVSVVLAHISQFDRRLQRLAFTNQIITRQQLQQELQAFSFLKRKGTAEQDSKGSQDIKRPRPSVPSAIKCFVCGRLGHKQSDCRLKGKEFRARPSGVPSTTTAPAPVATSAAGAAKPVVCYRCGVAGHVASRCPRAGGGGAGAASSGGGGGPSGASSSERRVDVCVVQPPSGTLEHNGETLKFHYDSGAECTLVKETVATKFHGKRINNVITLTGIGQSSVYSTEQILCEVKINDYVMEILLHVVPDNYLRSDIMIGREILNLGFSVKMTATEFVLSREEVVNSCTIECAQPNFNEIDTDVSGADKSKLSETLESFSEFFIRYRYADYACYDWRT